MRVTIIGNCQARPVADYIRSIDTEVTIQDIIITHLAKEDDLGRLEQAAAQSDFIFAQFVQSNYPTKFLRSNVLREQYGDRAVIWPNIFFKGQTPDLCYATAASGARIVGPLSDYHSRPIIDAWRAGLSADQAEELLTNGQPNLEWLTGLPASSLNELKRREQYCNVGVTEKIAELWRIRRYFFTFNHPVSDLMMGVASDLLALVGQRSIRLAKGSCSSEPLGQFQPPSWPPIVAELGLKFPTCTSSRGVSVDLSSGSVQIRPSTTLYSPRELISAFFACYELQRKLIAGCRFT
jgi:hypothetical protein